MNEHLEASELAPISDEILICICFFAVKEFERISIDSIRNGVIQGEVESLTGKSTWKFFIKLLAYGPYYMHVTADKENNESGIISKFVEVLKDAIWYYERKKLNISEGEYDRRFMPTKQEVLGEKDGEGRALISFYEWPQSGSVPYYAKDKSKGRTIRALLFVLLFLVIVIIGIFITIYL